MRHCASPWCHNIIWSRICNRFIGSLCRDRSPRLRIGAEHPFNPLVHLVPESQIPGWTEESTESVRTGAFVTPALDHHAYVFRPVLAAAALAAREKEALAAANQASSNGSVTSGKSNRSFRRQPPFYLDTNSVSSRGTWSNARWGTGRVPRTGGGSPRVGGSFSYHPGGVSPMNMQYAPLRLAQPPVGVGALPGPFPGVMAVPVAVSPQHGNMAGYAQLQQAQLQYMQQQQLLYQQYQAQMHPSMANSLSSSYGTQYGAQSPMSPSPMAHYMNTVTGANVQHPAQPVPPHAGYAPPMQQYAHDQQQQHQGSPKVMHGQQQRW
jgi:hypothetical protein